MPKRPRRGQEHGSDRSTDASDASISGLEGPPLLSQSPHLQMRARGPVGQRGRDEAYTPPMNRVGREKEKWLHFWGGLGGEKGAPALPHDPEQSKTVQPPKN